MWRPIDSQSHLHFFNIGYMPCAEFSLHIWIYMHLWIYILRQNDVRVENNSKIFLNFHVTVANRKQESWSICLVNTQTWVGAEVTKRSTDDIFLIFTVSVDIMTDNKPQPEYNRRRTPAVFRKQLPWTVPGNGGCCCI